MDIYSALEERLWDLFTEINSDNSDVPFIFSYEGGPELPMEYGAVHILDIRQVGRSAIPIAFNRNDKIDVRAVYRALVQITFVGDSSGSNSSQFYHMLNSPKASGAMQRHSLAVESKSNLRKAPQRRDSRWVQSYNFDLSLNFIINTPLTEDWFDNVRINTIVDGN